MTKFIVVVVAKAGAGCEGHGDVSIRARADGGLD